MPKFLKNNTIELLDGGIESYCKRKPPAVPVVPKSFSYAKKVSSFGRIVEVCQPPERTKGGIKSR